MHIGNFVETKQATLGPDSKANHLSYLGDAVIGSGVNVGAGSVISHDAPPGELTVARAKQRSIGGWKRPRKR